MTLIRVLILQCVWLLVILYGKFILSWILLLTAMILVMIDYNVTKPQVSWGKYIFLTLFFTLAGYLNDSSLMWFGFVKANSYSYANLSLWIIFIAYYEHIFSRLVTLPSFIKSLLGGIAGALTYWSAGRLGAVVIEQDLESTYVLYQFIFWAVFFPISLKLYFQEKYWDQFLDKTILFSFDRLGFIRHKKNFIESFDREASAPKTFLITGATAGIGESVADWLGRLKHNVIITGRNEIKGKSLEAAHLSSKFISLDMSSWDNVFDFTNSVEPLDGIVLNAGSMPEKLTKTENGFELQCATQLLGHYYLIDWLRVHNKLKPGARIIWVSSGGMYLKKLDIEALFNNINYDKVDTYANVKRAQVTLVEELALRPEWGNFYLASMHPGWVKTDGLKVSLPKFYNFMKNRLRSPEQGADTIIWSLLSIHPPESGAFYFDRKKVSPYIAESFSPSKVVRANLVERVKLK